MSESKDSLLKVVIIIKSHLDIIEIRVNEGLLININQRIYSNSSDINESVKAT